MPWVTTPRLSPSTNSPSVRVVVMVGGAAACSGSECVRGVLEPCWGRSHAHNASICTRDRTSGYPLPAGQTPPDALSIVSLAQRTCGRRKRERAGPDSCAAAGSPHPMLMASLRPVMNEVSEQETGEGQTLPSPHLLSHPDPSACPRPAPDRFCLLVPHPRQALYWSWRLSPSSTPYLFPFLSSPRASARYSVRQLL